MGDIQEKSTFDKKLKNFIISSICVIAFICFIMAVVWLFVLETPEYENSDFIVKFLAFACFIIILSTIAIPVCIIHFIISFIQKKFVFKYRFNFFRLFLVLVLLAIALLAICAFFQCTSAGEIKEGVYACGVFLWLMPSACAIAEGIIEKNENYGNSNNKDKIERKK